MNIPFLCVFLAFFLNYLTKIPLGIAMAKSKGGYNNDVPRDQQADLDGWGKRALGAHLNGFEVFPAFAAAVIIATLAGVNESSLAWLSLGFIITRIIYSILYLVGQSTLRTLCWAIGFVLIVTIFLKALHMGYVAT